jgi:hypothetical protein
MTEPKSPQSAAADHAASLAVGDPVDYSGHLGPLRGVVAEIRDLFDESGNRLKVFFVRIEGAVEHIITSADALAKVGKPAIPQSIEIPRSAYTDTTVPPAVDTRAAEEPGASGGGFDEPQPATPATPTNTNQGT